MPTNRFTVMPMRMIDAGILYALAQESDLYHQRAIELAKEYSDQVLVLTLPVLQEVAELMRRKSGNEAAFTVVERVLNASGVLLAFPTVEELKVAASVFRKNRELSFCDAVSATIAEKRGIREILSFDSDFDSFKNLRRLS